MSNTRELLEKYDVEKAGSFDLSVVIIGYVRQTSDSESVQMNVIERVLERWQEACAAKVAPEYKAKNKQVHDQLGRVMDTLESLRDEMADGT